MKFADLLDLPAFTHNACSLVILFRQTEIGLKDSTAIVYVTKSHQDLAKHLRGSSKKIHMCHVHYC